MLCKPLQIQGAGAPSRHFPLSRRWSGKTSTGRALDRLGPARWKVTMASECVTNRSQTSMFKTEGQMVNNREGKREERGTRRQASRTFNTAFYRWRVSQ
jgi:hypothetical protein